MILSAVTRREMTLTFIRTAAISGGRMAHSIRSLGSAALNFAMVAQGGLDLYWEIGCWPWDICVRPPHHLSSSLPI